MPVRHQPSSTSPRFPSSRTRGAGRVLPRALGAALIVAVVAAGCGTSGREMREVPEGQTGPTRSTNSTIDSASISTVPVVLSLTSSEWFPGEAVAAELTCDGEGRSPALVWTGVPTGTAELALVVRDDSDGWIHWIVSGIAATDGAVSAAELPLGSTEQVNDSGSAAWDPFCPPEGEDHHYSLELMALPAPAEPFTGDPSADVSNLERQASHRSVLTGTYSR